MLTVKHRKESSVAKWHFTETKLERIFEPQPTCWLHSTCLRHQHQNQCQGNLLREVRIASSHSRSNSRLLASDALLGGSAVALNSCRSSVASGGGGTQCDKSFIREDI